MGKIGILILLMLTLVIAVSPVHAYDDGKSSYGPLTRIAIVQGRGWTNLATFWLEPFRTFPAETKKHTRLWPITYLPRAFNNTLLRISSGGMDVTAYILYAPFTTDIRPLTDPFGLPNYAWQGDTENF